MLAALEENIGGEFALSRHPVMLAVLENILQLRSHQLGIFAEELGPVQIGESICEFLRPGHAGFHRAEPVVAPPHPCRCWMRGIEMAVHIVWPSPWHDSSRVRSFAVRTVSDCCGSDSSGREIPPSPNRT